MDEAEFGCLVPFTDASESYVNGFEAGIIWQRMTAGEKIIGGATEPLTHSENLEVFKRMADAMGYDITQVFDRKDGWMFVTFTKRNRKFRIVQGGVTDGENS